MLSLQSMQLTCRHTGKMPLADDVRARVLKHLQATGESQRSLAERADVKQANVSKFLRNLNNKNWISIEALERLAVAVGCPPKIPAYRKMRLPKPE